MIEFASRLGNDKCTHVTQVTTQVFGAAAGGYLGTYICCAMCIRLRLHAVNYGAVPFGTEIVCRKIVRSHVASVDSPLAVHLCWHRNLEPSVWNFAVDATRCFVSTQNRDHYHVTTRITNHRFPLPYPCNVVTQSSGHVSVPLVTIKRLCGMCINMPIVPARGDISCKESRCINNIWTLSSGLATIH